SIEEASEMNRFRYVPAAAVLVAALPAMLLWVLVIDADAAPHAALGGAVAACDFNGDGFVDLAADAPFENVGDVVAAGVVHVLYGTIAGVVDHEQTWNEGTVGVGESPETGAEFGAVLATGDFDGDGFCDLAIGTPQKSVGPLNEAGTVIVLRGGP